MKRTLIIGLIALATVFSITSCASTKGGCKGTQGLIGYGSSR